MPSIPIASPLAYIGVLFFIVGIFLIITGLDIVKVEKLTVTPGRRTWITGALLALLGALFLMPDIFKAVPTTNISPTASPTPPPTATAPPTAAPSATPPPTATAPPTAAPSATPPPTATAPPTAAPSAIPPPTATAPEQTVQPRHDILDALTEDVIDNQDSRPRANSAAPDDQLARASTWSLVVRDEFTNQLSRADWSIVIPPTGRFDLQFNGAFDARIEDSARSVWAVLTNMRVDPHGNYLATLTLADAPVSACSYGLALQIDTVNLYYYYAAIDIQRSASMVWFMDWKTFASAPLTGKRTLPTIDPVEKVSVLKIDNEYTFYVNDTAVDTFHDDRLSQARIGIAMVACPNGTETRFAFDAFEVRSE